jgi:hypothetical protein
MNLALVGSTWRVGQHHLMVYLPLKLTLLYQKLKAQNFDKAVPKPLEGMFAWKHHKGQLFQLWTNFDVIY